MDELIFIKKKNETSEVLSYQSESTDKVRVRFQSGKEYLYKKENVKIYHYSEELPVNNYQYRRLGQEPYTNVVSVKKYSCADEVKIMICFKNGNHSIIDSDNLEIEESVFLNEQSHNIFSYLEKLADLNELRGEDGSSLLSRNYAKVDFISKKTVLTRFLLPNPSKENSQLADTELIFPFGCNNSQFAATKSAMENQISLIQGPPGTGKTQTILNILSNILYRGQTALVVSNNNSAIANISEKLAQPEIALDFLTATLGSRENKELFLSNQSTILPDYLPEFSKDISKDVDINNLIKIFSIKEQEADIKSELALIETEYKHFQDYISEQNILEADLSNLSSRKFLELLLDCENLFEHHKKVGFIFKLKSLFKYRIKDFTFYDQNPMLLATTIQKNFYESRILELRKTLSKLKCQYQRLSGNDIMMKMESYSKAALKYKLSQRFIPSGKRKLFKNEDFDTLKSSNDFLREYPIVLSTTFSAKNCLNKSVLYDYLIIDEASQVDIATGALALSCAKNVVVVGDLQQLPNIVTKEIGEKAERLRKDSKIKPSYSFEKNFLEVMTELFPDEPQTLLREHYRCHPKIIQFCNHKFYDGQLHIMTEDKGEEDVLLAYKSVKGNHARNHTNQREVDIIKQEVIQHYHLNEDKTGIIAPYRNQVNLLQEQVGTFVSDTVHKFQGREYDTMIVSTVDNQITRFTDDAHLLNVAVSRAKEQLIMVTSGNQQRPDKNISDLMGYISYQNCDIKQSQIRSVFDYLYKQYEKRREEYFKNKQRHSEYDSENLMHELIKEILLSYPDLDVVTQYRLRHLIRDVSLLTDAEKTFANQSRTSLDFLIFNKITRVPVLAIEVDGYRYHHHPDQIRRDTLKNSILQKYHIPLLRLPTNGSREKDQLVSALSDYEQTNRIILSEGIVDSI
ncbi:AAA domain-containing protein [Streptococcus ferus]|uniref:Exonuclease V subunit alpha n=1 Tax=Streptococcus ferus TaxID=1345 RepID=A0A2X3VNJ3_9STRE|nr:AAA domain-containing protein [Streptococcus ferus]SQF40988.1 exonuclease V subunit alpha [Streptococcus ferus]